MALVLVGIYLLTILFVNPAGKLNEIFSEDATSADNTILGKYISFYLYFLIFYYSCQDMKNKM